MPKKEAKMKSIIQADRNRCYLCGRIRSAGNPLDEHHVYFGPNRTISERYGLKVYICAVTCHNFGPESVHMNAQRCRELQAEVQKTAMDYYGWTTRDFIGVIGKNYTEEMP